MSKEVMSVEDLKMAIDKAKNDTCNIEKMLDMINLIEYSDTLSVTVELMKDIIRTYMCDFQTNYAIIINYLSDEYNDCMDKLFEFGEEVDIDNISDGIDRFDYLSGMSNRLSMDIKSLNDIIFEYKKQMLRIPKCLMDLCMLKNDDM